MILRRMIFAASAVLTIALVGCDGLYQDDEVRIRVRNTGSVDLQMVAIGFAAAVEDYGDVEAGTATPYREFDHAYRYGYIEASAGDERFVLQPVDYVGESRLPGGSYTYELAVDPAGPNLIQRLVRD